MGLWARKVFLVAALGLVQGGFASAGEVCAEDDWTIVPGVRVGGIMASTTFEGLREFYGAANVNNKDIYIRDGRAERGTVLFPKEPDKTLEILWPNDERPLTVIIKNEGTVWKTDKGITIGTSLKAIEKRNKGPFTLKGFDWDYSGTVAGVNGGELKEINDRTLCLRLYPRRAYYAPEVQGDYEFSSSNPTMQKLNPCVYEIVVELR